MNKVKICYVNDTWFPIIGGGTQVLYYYSKILSLNPNFKITILTRNLSSDFKLDQKIKSNITVCKLGKKTRWNNGFSRIRFLLEVFIHLIKNEYEIVHVFPFISSIPCIFARIFKKFKVVYSFFSFSKNPINVLIEKILFFLPYDLIVTDNYDIYTKYKKNRSIKYLVNGVDVKLFEEVRTKSKKRQIIYVGRFHKQKGIINLLNIFKRISHREKSVKLKLIGYGEEVDTIRNFVSYNKMKERVIIQTPTTGKKLIREYKESLFLLLPSLFEGQGIVSFEAWMSKIPVIASKTGSLKKYIKNSINGFLVDQNNIEQFVNKSLLLINNQALRNRMGRNGYNQIRKNADWYSVVKRLETLYYRLIATK